MSPCFFLPCGSYATKTNEDGVGETGGRCQSDFGMFGLIFVIDLLDVSLLKSGTFQIQFWFQKHMFLFCILFKESISFSKAISRY